MSIKQGTTQAEYEGLFPEVGRTTLQFGHMLVGFGLKGVLGQLLKPPVPQSIDQAKSKLRAELGHRLPSLLALKKGVGKARWTATIFGFGGYRA